MSISGYSANYSPQRRSNDINDKDKKLYVATQILSSLVIRGGIDRDKAVDIALRYTNRLMYKLEEEDTND